MEKKFLLIILILVTNAFIGHRLIAATEWCVTSATNLTSVGALTITTSSQNSSSTPTGKAPYWSFSGTAGETYYFSFASSTNTSDTYMVIFDGLYSSGTSKLVAANDDNGGSLKSAMTFVCPATQTYYLLGHTATSPFLFPNPSAGTVVLTYYKCGTVTSQSLPVAETWASSNLNTACTSWKAHGAAEEGDWIFNTGSFAYGANLAGGTGNEVVFTGYQHNIYGIGASKAITLTSYPISSASAFSVQVSWKHSLQTNGDAGVSGSNTIVLKMQSSFDQITWTDQWSGSYTVGASATTQINKVTQTASVPNPSGNATTYIRFYMLGVPGKVTFWAIDNGNSALPIELEKFSAKEINDKTRLEWITASEVNNNFFTVERSTDGNEFIPVSTVKGAGNSTSRASYFTYDESPVAGNNYYRLKQTDYDGKFAYSDIIKVNYRPTKPLLGNFYPNPAADDVSFPLFSPERSVADIQIIDVTGRIASYEQQEISKGDQVINASLSSLETGVYYIKVSIPELGYCSTSKIIKN